MASDLLAAFSSFLSPLVDKLESRLADRISQIEIAESTLSSKLLLKPNEAADALSISVRTLKELSTSGVIPRVELGPRTVRYSVDDLRRVISERRHTNDSSGGD